MIAGEDQHERGIVLTDDVEILQHRVGGALVPRGLDALLGRQQFHEFTQLGAQEPPAVLDMTQQ